MSPIQPADDPLPDSLKRLLADGRVQASRLSGTWRTTCLSLFEAGVLTEKRSGGGLLVEVRRPEIFRTFIDALFPGRASGLPGRMDAATPAAGAVAAVRDSKRRAARPREPVFLRAFAEVTAHRDGVVMPLLEATRRAGITGLLIEQNAFWSMTARIAIVENLECFLCFEQLGARADVALYAAGRLSDLAIRWLAAPEMGSCTVVHLGDYDPVGLDEYLRLKTVLGSRVSLHVPPGFERLVRTYGKAGLLTASPAVMARLREACDPDVRAVCRIIDETGLGLEQEALLIPQ